MSQQEQKHKHKHHSHKHRADGSEREKHHRLTAAKRRKILGKILLVATTLLAIFIAAWTWWAYHNV